MSNRDILNEMEYDKSVVFENPDYDEAIIGVSENGSVIYDYDLMIQHLVESDGMTEEEAVEFIDYNTIRAIPYAPNPKPIIMYPLWEIGDSDE